ncbi:MAG: amino acid permease [Aeriscardovia sp.]|nr:amino acid permease [Aeriscardovia sp.]
MSTQQKRKKLTGFGFFAMTASMVMTVYEFPSLATAKFACVFFALVGGIFWFLPTALISAEMASVEGWSEGGVFGWVGNALHSERLGYVALFCQWFEVTIGFVTMCYFVIGMISDTFGWMAPNTVPELKFFEVLILFGIINLLQLHGTKATAQIAKVGFFLGVFIPGFLLFILALIYIGQGNHLAIVISPRTFFPDFREEGTLTIFATFILMYAGIESSGTHINELENSTKNYPRTMIAMFVLAIIMDSLGGMSIAATVPQSKLSMNAGMYQALDFLMCHFNSHLGWLAGLFSVFMALGIVAEIGSWIVGPSKGLQDSAWYGLMPKWVSHQNKYGVPTYMITAQFCVVAIWDAVLTFGGGGNGNMSFLIATTLTSLVYLVCYVLMYVSYFRLIYTEKKLKRTYNVPGGIVGKTIFACCGLLCSLFAFAVSFIPTSALPSSDGARFVRILTYCFLGTVILAFTIPAFRRHYLKKLDLSEIRVMHFRLLWHRVPPVVQTAVDAARKRHHVVDVNGHLVRMPKDKNGKTTSVEKSDRFEHPDS